MVEEKSEARVEYMTCDISYRPHDGSEVRKRKYGGMVHSTFVFARPPFWGRTGCQKVGLNDGKMKLKQWYNFLFEKNSGCSEEVLISNNFKFLMESYLENIHDLLMEIGPWLNATESRGNAQSATHTQAANSAVNRIPWQT